jgi:hypothetical protein
VYLRWGFSEGGAPVAATANGSNRRSERYRLSMVGAAEAAATKGELHALLDEENITVDDLIEWGAAVPRR